MYRILPTLLLTAFKIITFEELVCPYERFNREEIKGLIEIHSYSSNEYNLKEDDLDFFRVSGIACKRVELSTGCKFHWFASNDLVHRSTVLSEQDIECEDGYEEVSEYPDPQCVAGLFSNEYNYVSVTKVLRKEISYLFDPRKGELKSFSDLFSSKTKGLYIYKDNKGTWRPYPNKKMMKCDSFEEIGSAPITIRVYQDPSKQYTVVTVADRDYMIDEICCHDMCGVRIGHTVDGVSFKLPHNLNVRQCNTELNTEEIRSEVILDREKIEECEETRVNLIHKDKAKYDDIAHFQPNRPGVYHVYKITDAGKLSRALAKYSKVDSSALKDEYHWVSCGVNTRCTYNGEMQPNVTNFKMDIQKMRLHLEEVEKGIMVYNDYNITAHIDSETKSYYVNSIQSGLLNALPWFAEVALIVVIIIVILKICLNRRSRHSSYKAPDNLVEMSSGIW